MYPKSPFKAGSQLVLFTTVQDDAITNFKPSYIQNVHDRCTFMKIKSNIEKINEQLYNLRVSTKCSSGVNESACQIQTVMSKLTIIKQTLRQKGLVIIKKYGHKEQSTTKDMSDESSQYEK